MENQVPGKNKAVASLVLGIVSLVAAWFGWGAILAIILSIVGIVLAVQAKKEMPAGTSGLAIRGNGLFYYCAGALLHCVCQLCAVRRYPQRGWEPRTGDE